MRSVTCAALLGLLVLAGCSRGSNNTATNQAPPANDATQSAQNTQSVLDNANAEQRNGVFIRAILDANQPCQHVTGSTRGPTIQGHESWIATCVGGAQYQIVITGPGAAQVTAIGNGGAAATGNAQ